MTRSSQWNLQDGSSKNSERQAGKGPHVPDHFRVALTLKGARMKHLLGSLGIAVAVLAACVGFAALVSQ